MRDLAMHIIDLVQNSVEAGARNVVLVVDENVCADRLTISIKDDGRGMDAKTLAGVRNPFVTSRTTRDVGLGLPLIDMSTQRSEGSLDISSEPGKGTKVVASYRYSHIDRPPLGDIATTIKIIVISYQQITFRYEHYKNSAEFILDTNEMRDILGQEVDFSEGMIRQWLDEYLKQGLHDLNNFAGGV